MLDGKKETEMPIWCSLLAKTPVALHDPQDITLLPYFTSSIQETMEVDFAGARMENQTTAFLDLREISEGAQASS
jgi:hypothetical protein